MKLYTTFTPSHRVFYDNYFLPTLPNGFDLKVVEDTTQPCKLGAYYTDGWTQTTKKKIDLFVDACLENIGNYFFYCDVDVQFFDSNIIEILLEEIEDCDIACQDDILSYNSGVFICKSNQKTIDMFSIMKEKYDYIDDDQRTLNKYIKMCKHKKLSNRFFTVGMDLMMRKNIRVPDNIVLHHANWVFGIENKISILNLIKSQYDTTSV